MKRIQCIVTTVIILLATALCIIISSQTSCTRCARIFDIHGGDHIDFKANSSYYYGFNPVFSIFYVTAVVISIIFAIDHYYELSLIVISSANIILVTNVTSFYPYFEDPNNVFSISHQFVTRSFSGFITGYYEVCNTYYNLYNGATVIVCPYDSNYPDNNSLWLLVCYYILAPLLLISSIVIGLYLDKKHLGSPPVDGSGLGLELELELDLETSEDEGGGASGAMILSGSETSIVNMEYSNSDADSVNSNSRLLVAPA